MRTLVARLSPVRRIATVLLFGAFLLTGYVVAEHEIFPYSYLKKAERAIGSVVRGGGSVRTGPKGSREIPTVFVRLSVTDTHVPLDQQGPGGGLTSFGDELVLVSVRGEIFMVKGESVTKAEIEAPDDGFRAYERSKTLEKYKDYNIDTQGQRPRYHDVLYYSEGEEHGLLLSYTEYSADRECYSTAVAQLELPMGVASLSGIERRAEAWDVVYRTQPCLPLKRKYRALEGHMAGGRISYRSPYKVLLASGDYHWDGVYGEPILAQDTTNDYGKVLEISLVTRDARKLSVGNRNMQGLLVDAEGNVWATEHGPRGGDELNLIRGGANYGWPIETLGTRYNTLPWPGEGAYGRHDLHTKPVFAWVPSVAVSNVTQVSGFHPSWDGDLLVASLRARTLFRVRVDGERVVFVEPVEVHERIRYAHQHSDGRIVLWTDSNRLLFLTASETNPTSVVIDDMISASDLNPTLKENVRVTVETCSNCHSFSADDHTTAPGLGSIYESDIASTSYQGYSRALLAKDGTWSEEALRAFLKDPQSFAPGTSMPNPGIENPAVLRELIEVLRKIKQEDG